MRKLLYLILLVLIFTSSIYSQEYKEGPYDPRPSFGIFGGAGLNLHTGSFSKLEGIANCCPEFKDGTGFGYNFGVFYALPMGKQWELVFRGTYTDLSGELTTIEEEVLSDGQGGSVNGEFEHRMEGTFNSAGLQVLAAYRLSDQLRVNFGVRGGMLLTKDFYQIEEIITPDYGVFEYSQKSTRFENEGEIPNAASLELALMFGASYDLPLNKEFTWFLVPEASLSLGLTEFAPNTSWQANLFHGGIGLRYAPRTIIPPTPPPPPPPPPPLPPPPPPPSTPVLDASILAVSVDENNAESEFSRLTVEEFLSTRTHPIMNYVFFDENSSSIPGRYVRISDEEREDFSVRRLFNLKTMDVYHRVLDIVGKRMSVYPQATLEITGCNSDVGPEKDNIELSKRRANVVRDYLVNAWKIEPSRLTMKSRNLPEVPSNQKVLDGQQENQRVELKSNLTDIFEPMIIQDTLRISNPPHIRFKPLINAEMGIQSWKIKTSQNGRELRVFSGLGEPPQSIDWEVEREEEQVFVPRFDEPLTYKLEVIDNDNKVWESPPQKMEVEQITIEKKLFELIEDKEIDKFSLILFDFNKAELSKDNAGIVQIAKDRIRENSEVKITGYTDRQGDEELNKNLSKRRADATAKALGIPLDQSFGVGESILLYNNDTPEGRFYSRTVIIEIITTIE